MSDQESNETVETHISQPQWLPNNFMVGTALEEADSFFEALAQGMNLLSIPNGPFNVKSLRQACSEYAEDHQDWHQVITEDALNGGYATSSGQQACIDSYLVRIQLTPKEISVLNIAGPALRGRPNIEGHMLCQKYGIKLHLIEKHTTDSEEVVHELVDSEGSRPIPVDETVRLYNQPRIIHILNERWIQSFAPVSGVNHSPQMLSLSDPSSPKRKLHLISEEENAFHAKKRCVGLPDEEEDFQALGIKRSLHGMAYQWKLLMLFAYNSHQLGYDFRLATEINAAEKFDDVVLQYVKAGSDVKHFRFLQAKHFQTESDNKKITATDLLQKKDGKFSLQKYFLSFQKIKRNILFQSGELQDFIICTNNDFDFDNGFQHQSLKKLHDKEPLYLEPVTEADEMLNVGGERYRFVSSSHPERKAVVSVLKSFFDETSECRMLAKKLAEHLLEGKTITLSGLFKDYHMPLASCVFNIRGKKLAKKFVEGKLDDGSCPGSLAFREALREAIVERLKGQPKNQNKPPPKKIKLTHHCTDSDTLWNDIGELELKFSKSFSRAFIPHSEPQLRNPASLAEEIAHLINTKKTLDETVNIEQGEKTIISQELSHLAGHVFVKRGANVMFSQKFLTGNSLAGNIQDLWNTLCKVLDVNSCQELKYKLSNCTFHITNFKTCQEDQFKGLAELQVTDDKVEEFLDRLIFAVNQPNEERLSELISDKMGKELNLIDGDLITSDFQSRMLDWLKEKHGRYQSKKTVGKFFCDLREKVCQLILIGPTSEHVKTLKEYGIQFNDNVLPAALKKFLEDETSVFNYITDPKQSFLGSIKVNQVMEGISAYKAQGSFIFIGLKNLLLLKEEALRVFREQQCNLLIVECKEELGGQIETLSRELSEIIKERRGKKVILIAPHNHPLVSQFKTGEHKPRYQEMVDEFKFGDLTSDSQKKLLEKTVKFQGIETALNELMSTDSAITKKLPLASLVKGKKLKIGQPVPEPDGYDEEFYIGRTLNYQNDENPTSYSTENLDKLILQAQRQKVMLISDRAGMGKTTTLTHLSKQIKQHFPSHWVVRINLNDHTDALQTQKRQKIEAVEFLSQRLLKFNSYFEKELFEQRLEEGKVVVMLDSFDEISPSYERTVIDLLQALKKTSVQQLWVTTRPHLRETLEENLQQQHCYTLEPFSKGNQVEFLTKIWCQKLNLQGTSQKQLEEYATAIIEKLQQSINDTGKEFTGVPLQTRMLAEAFDQSDVSEHNLPDKFDLLDLYKRFTERKYDIYWEDKMKTAKSNVAAEEQRERDFSTVREEHQCLAFQMLFPKEVIGIFKDNRQSAFKPKQLARYGIVHYIDNKPHFIHRTFAEYYVADFLIDKLSKETTPGKELLDFLLKDILLQENCQVICSFLDGFLEKWKPSKGILEQSGKGICELWKDDADGGIGQKLLGSLGRTILHQAAQEGHPHIIRYLLDSLKAGQHLETICDLFLAKNTMEQTAWHLSVETGHLKASEELWDWAKEAKLNLKDDLMLAEDKNRQTVCHLAAWNKHPQVLKQLLVYAEAELSQQELKNLLLAVDEEEQTVWHLAAWENLPEVFQNLMEWAKKANLDQQEFKELLLQKDYRGRTPWHFATLNNHPEVYEWVTMMIKDPQEQKELLKKLLLDKDKAEQTIWHLAARSIHPDVFKKRLDVAEKALSKEELLPLLQIKDVMGQTAWHLSAENGRADSLNTLWEWAKKVHLHENEFKNNWMLSQDSRGSAWHLAAQRGHVTVLKKLWDWAREMNLNLKEDLLLVRDVSGRTAGHLAAEMGNTGTLEEILHWDKEAKLNFAADLLLAKDRNGQTPLQLLKDSFYIRRY